MTEIEICRKGWFLGIILATSLRAFLWNVIRISHGEPKANLDNCCACIRYFIEIQRSAAYIDQNSLPRQSRSYLCQKMLIRKFGFLIMPDVNVCFRQLLGKSFELFYNMALSNSA